MNDYIDIYCERLAFGFWEEPVNALTNVSFLIAAGAAFMLAQEKKALDWRAGLLCALILSIGIGSFLFHTLAVGWAQLADVLPILFYQIAFLQLYAGRVMGLRCRFVYMLLAGFLLTIYAFGQLPADWQNGSLSYGPALIFVTGLGVWHFKFAATESWGLLAAAGVFLVSLIFRSIDMEICDFWTQGSHFLWHILNGVVLYLTTRAYILNAGVTSCGPDFCHKR